MEACMEASRPRPKQSEEQRRTTRRAKRIEKAAKRPKLSRADEERLRNRIMWITCCDWWAQLAFYEAIVQGVNAKSKAVASVLEEYEIFPPPTDTTPMKVCWCAGCGGIRKWPAHYVGSAGYSFECVLEICPPRRVERVKFKGASAYVESDE